MIGLLVTLAFSAVQPVKILVTPDPVNSDGAMSAICVQSIADELRRYGLAVTTDADLTAIAAGRRQEQIAGCEDKDCGLDADIVMTGEAKIHCLISGTDDLTVMMRVLDMKPRSISQIGLGTPQVGTSKRGLASDARATAPEIVELLRKRFGEDRVAAQPLKDGPGAPPAPRRCSATGGGAVLLAAVLLARAKQRAAS